jgi:hypothetical protein
LAIAMTNAWAIRGCLETRKRERKGGRRLHRGGPAFPPTAQVGRAIRPYQP